MGLWDCFRPCGGGDSWSRCIRLNLIQIYSVQALCGTDQRANEVLLSSADNSLLIWIWPMHVSHMIVTSFILCGRSFCKSSQDLSFFLLFFWLFPCPITQRIIWLIAHLLSSAMISQANFSVKTFSSLVCGFSKIHLSCYGFTCSEPFLSKGFQQSTLRVKQRFQTQVFIRKSC